MRKLLLNNEAAINHDFCEKIYDWIDEKNHIYTNPNSNTFALTLPQLMLLLFFKVKTHPLRPMFVF